MANVFIFHLFMKHPVLRWNSNQSISSFLPAATPALEQMYLLRCVLQFSVGQRNSWRCVLQRAHKTVFLCVSVSLSLKITPSNCVYFCCECFYLVHGHSIVFWNSYTIILYHMILYFETWKITLSHELGSKWVSEQMSERSWMREQSEQCGTSKQMSGASKRVNEQASGLVLASWF